ncbi:MAG: DUF3343 domain-containing protein [Oscillospiraceae bacterium]|nr:DUF3343 domain-containing protein [Oscillospiraceae bacterium]
MYDYYLTFKSITGAQQGEGLLLRQGIRVRLQRSPAFLSKNGCGYALKMRSGDVSKAVGLLRLARISFGGVYRVDSSGNVEETLL